MKLLLVFNVCLMIFSSAWAQATDQSKQVFVLEINDIISPATADYFERSMDKANQANTEFILLKMDRSGGLDLSMRKIIKKIIASHIPVVTYLTPSSSRATSAGAYILYASHIAAMSPATNLGATTPVQLIPSLNPGGDKPSPEDETEIKQTLFNFNKND